MNRFDIGTLSITRDPKKRICNGICKKYRVTKPIGTGRYESGQARCQTWDIWIDHKGCILKDGRQATQDTVGWTCKCCSFRVRQKPRGSYYKQKFHDKTKKSLSE